MENQVIDQKRLYRAIGETIVKWRNSRTPKLTQEELANILEVERTTLSAIEGGKQKAPLHLLYRISVQFSIPLTKLLPPTEEFLSRHLELESVPEKTRSVITRLQKKN